MSRPQDNGPPGGQGTVAYTAGAMAGPPPRLLFSAGEASGELYAAELLRHLRQADPRVEGFGLGGDRLAEQGARLLFHVRDLAVMGLVEVIRHLRRLRGIFAAVLAEVDRQRPDLAVLVDYPDFNLRLARELHRRGVPVVYYVSPQLWAWRRGRMRQIQAHVRRMLVIFPFEEPLYRAAGVPVTFVGHPLVELVRPPDDRAGLLREAGLDPGRPVLAVLPGSRPGEIAHNLPVLARALGLLRERRPDVQPLLAQAPALDPALVRAHLGGLEVARVTGRATAVLAAAQAALVASGTATVETALVGTPMTVVYRVSPVSYFLGRRFVSVSHFAMVNLIAGREVVTELIQRDFTPERVLAEALRLLAGGPAIERMRADLAEVRARLGGTGASARAAEAVATELRAARGEG